MARHAARDRRRLNRSLRKRGESDMVSIRSCVAIVLGALSLSLASCSCFGDKCIPAKPGSALAVQAPPKGAPPQEAFTVLPDPTVGIIMSELKEMLGQLSTLAETVSGETKSVIQQAQASASQLLAEIDHTLGKRQDRLVKDLTQAEQRMLADAELLIETSKRAANEIQAGAFQNARETLYETDIIAYNALRDLPCGDKEPRLVYAKPFQFRVWKGSELTVDPEAGDPDAGKPANVRKEAYVTVRGNYLAYRAPTVRVRIGSGQYHDAQIQTPNHNGFVVIVGPEAMAELEQIQRPTPLEVQATLHRCPEGKGGTVQPRGVSVTVLPPLTYDIATIIRPQADLPAFGDQAFAYSEMGSDRCDDRKPIDQTYSVGPEPEVVDWVMSIRSLGGNSGINRVDRSGPHSVRVQATLQGKGRRCVLGFCECRGRGWVDYGLRVAYKTYQTGDLLPSTLAREVTSTKLTYLFPYPHAFPPDMRNLACRYYTRVIVSEGESKAEVELSEIKKNANTPFGMVQSDWDPSTCKVTVTVPMPLVAMLERSK
jgi:hypothetical protein